MPNKPRSSMKLKNFPEKVYLDDVITALKLTEMSVIGALKTILLYSRSYNLPIYFNEEIYGSKVSGTFDEIHDQNGEIERIMVDESLFLGANTGSKLIIIDEPYFDGSNYYIDIHQFTHENDDYYAVDETGMWIDSLPHHYNRFYSKGTELQVFIDALENSDKDTQKKGKPSKLELREEAFKNWLAAKAGLDIKYNADYQKCYFDLRQPTQDETWDMLQMMNKQLFGSGKDDFFRNQEVINFTIGTSRGR